MILVVARLDAPPREPSLPRPIDRGHRSRRRGVRYRAPLPLCAGPADHLALGLASPRPSPPWRVRSPAGQLQAALDSRVVNEQAKGIVATRRDVDMAVAFDLICQHARDHDRKIHDVAGEIVSGDLEV